MLGETGEPCGLNLAALADKLGVERVEAPFCGTALVEFGGYNRTWKCRAPAVAMYDRGSLFQLVCSEAPHRSCSTPLRTGGSDGDTEQILRSWDGTALLQGSSIAGAMREHLAASDAGMAERLFGSQKQSGHLIVSDGALT